MAPEIYWNIRRSSLNVRAYMSLFWQWSKTSQLFQDLWLAAEVIDTELSNWHTAHGTAGVVHALQTSDTLEHLLCKIASEHALLKHKDQGMADELNTSQPPGLSDLAPSWAMDSARGSSKALHLQRSRSGGGRGGRKTAQSSSDEDATGAARRRKKTKKKKAVGEGGTKPPVKP